MSKLGNLYKNRLKWFLSLVTFLSIVIPALVFGGLEIYFRYQNDAHYRSQEQARALLNVLQEGLVPPLWSFIPENADTLLAGVALDPAVTYIKVWDHLDGEFVAYQHPIQRVTGIQLSAPILRKEEIIGRVELGYSVAPARAEALHDSFRVFVTTSMQVVTTLILILFVIQRRVTGPLTRLKKFASQVAARNFDAQSNLSYQDEFQELANELDAMKLALKSSFDLLEDRVKERTLDLTKVNEELKQTIHQLENAKDSLVQSEKLAALGSLVAGVSHELNTPIGNARVVTSSLRESSESLLNDFKNGAMTKSRFLDILTEITEGAALIESSLLKSIDLVQSFKQVAVDRASERRRIFQLNDFINEIQSTMRHLFKANPYNLVLKLEADVEINSYPGELGQVVSNLINNALLHGMEGQETGQVLLKTYMKQDKVVIEVSDDGVGMSDEVRNRIFEPFFTTKLGKGGSGLGMHIVYNLVNGVLGGQLEVESSPGNGTVMRLVIPTVSPEVEN